MTFTPREIELANQATLPQMVAGGTIWLLSLWTMVMCMFGHWPWW